MTCHYDGSGSVTQISNGMTTWNYTYDPENRLTLVEKNGAVLSRFYYDADDRRVRLWDSQSGYLTHVYSGLDIVYENASDALTRHFYANGLHIAENRSGTVEYYHQDHLGSTRLKASRWPPGKSYKRKHFRLHWRLGRDPGPGEDAG